MTENTVATHQCEAVRWAECLDCEAGQVQAPNIWREDDDQWEKHDDCQGTGLRFNGLSRECYVAHCSWHGQDPRTCSCDGSGRVPVDDEGAWLDASEALAGRFWALEPVFDDYQCWISPEGYGRGFTGGGATRLEAIQEAVCKATGQHHEEESK